MSDLCFSCCKELPDARYAVFTGTDRHVNYCDSCLSAIHPGAVCEHGGLKRQCLVCERDAEVLTLHAEIERLKGAGVGYSQQTVDAISKERDRLRAENEVLRGLLAETYRLVGHELKFQSICLHDQVVAALGEQR